MDKSVTFIPKNLLGFVGKSRQPSQKNALVFESLFFFAL